MLLVSYSALSEALSDGLSVNSIALPQLALQQALTMNSMRVTAAFAAVFAAIVTTVKVIPRRRLKQVNQPPRCKRFNAAYH